MAMTQRKLTDDYANFAEEEFKSGTITPQTFYKVMLQIASEYLTEHGDEEACMKSINRVDPEFIKNDLVFSMESDPFLAACMVDLTYHLERRGLTIETPIRPTQGEAQA